MRSNIKIQSKSVIMRWLCCLMPSKSRYSSAHFEGDFKTSWKHKKNVTTWTAHFDILCGWEKAGKIMKLTGFFCMNYLRYPSLVYRSEIFSNSGRTSNKKPERFERHKNFYISDFSQVFIRTKFKPSFNKVIYFEATVPWGKRAYKAAGVQKQNREDFIWRLRR